MYTDFPIYLSSTALAFVQVTCAQVSFKQVPTIFLSDYKFTPVVPTFDQCTQLLKLCSKLCRAHRKNLRYVLPLIIDVASSLDKHVMSLKNKFSPLLVSMR